MNERLAASFHEAGHAVVGLVLGMAPRRIELHLDRQPIASVGWGRDWKRPAPWAEAVTHYSGPAAEARAVGCPIDDTLFESDHERSDVAKLAEACRRLSAAGHFTSAEDAFRFVVNRGDALLDRYWRAVERVARALDGQCRLNERAILGAVRGRRPYGLGPLWVRTFA